MTTPQLSRRSSAVWAQRAAVVSTVAAVVALNVVLAYILARVAGMRGIELPTVAVWLLAIAGVATAGAAALLWRRYLRERRGPPSAR
jgi:membrane protein implicated in regulation of membrane protease activity